MSVSHLKLSLVFFSFAIIASCSKESSQQEQGVEVDFTCNSCEYNPVCIGPKYTYDLTLFDTLADMVPQIWQEEFLSVEKDTMINGLGYEKIIKGYIYDRVPTPDTNRSVLFYNCANNVTTSLTYQPEVINGDTLFYPIATTLKADAPLLATWSDVFTMPSGKKNETIYTMQEKNISRIVYGTTYNNVIHVSCIHKINDETDWTGDYYWAKNIGLIDHPFGNGSSGINAAHYLLKKFVP